MASVIALCGKPVQMSRYARLMLHSVQGGCYGNKEEMRGCIREIESLEDTLCEMYAARMGKDKEEIRSLYFDGKDTGCVPTKLWRWALSMVSMMRPTSGGQYPRTGISNIQ